MLILRITIVTKTYKTMAIAVVKNKKQRFEATGFVLGFLWLGDLGAYPAKKVKTDTREKLLDVVTDMLADGSLDSGMGFNGLKGALIDIKTIETLTIKGKEYENENTETVFLGELEPEEIELLENCAFNM